ncbi:Natural resistance-associated macrophage protein superfamily protein [Haloferax volcanii DSM 14919]|uniref:Natural resistance-associated macrophage protein superfamily protein n=1 Tax=Haloferax lucentense (strain DSM 14919 / JCM 9276 / NCIMB 13854 / Aa 2.2) TaxID=1230452 RepID=M0GWW2_HALL2|nr:divalent metal cation transporter [Haloferax lucentense]ELZ76751.1 Natural resistance-associated macrophage protein superfamily protein [Haloferax lucentense DSM 14919]
MNEPRLDVSAVTGGDWRGYLSEMGPSWVAGAVAAGPATMATVLTAGATFGYAMLWVVVLSAVLGASAQYLSMRLGLLTEDGIVSVVERELGDGWAWVLVADAVLAAGLAQLVIMQGLANVSATITGVDARVWGVVWAVVLAAGLAGRGYRFVELLAKGLVAAVVVAFLASLVLVPIDPAAAAGGLVPRVPSGVDGALVAAGILGGAVHITLITMHSYTMRARGWTTRDYGLATFDVGASMLVAFGVYSLAIFLVAASVLHSPEVAAGDLTAVAAAQALGPIAGANAKWLFLFGLLGAAVSTLGGNTVVPPFLVADKLGWGTDLSDGRYRALLAGVALFSGVGAFLGGAFFPLLVLVLAFGLVGTPFAIAVVLVLLNGDAVSEPNSTPANLGGVVLFAVTTVLAANFVRSRALSDLGDPLSVFVVVFAAAMGAATLGLLGKFVRETVGRPTAA